MRFLAISLTACAASPSPKSSSASTASGQSEALDSAAAAGQDLRGGTVLAGATVLGAGPCGAAPCDLRVEGSAVVAVGPPGTVTQPEDTVVELGGGFLVPAFIDSHVHFSYREGAAAMAEGGVAAAVDLAAPREDLSAPGAPLTVLRSGPMLTAVGGYPTQGWGRNGYGWELATEAEAATAVETLAAEGAAVVKSPVGVDGPAAPLLAAIGAAAAAAGLPFATHALGDAEALAAAEAGATVLAHTPVQPLGPAALVAWSDKAVITTLAAFGGSDSTVANLRALRTAGATLLYGTDYGNTRTAGIDGAELALLQAAGLDGTAIITAGTSAPASFWGLDHLGSLAPGKRASMLWVAADPRGAPERLASPERVWIDGLEQ